MGIIQKIISKHKEKVRARNDMCDNLIMQIDTALQEITIIFSDLQSFVEPSKESEWHNRNSSLMTNVALTNTQKIKKAVHYKNYWRNKLNYIVVLTLLNNKLVFITIGLPMPKFKMRIP